MANAIPTRNKDHSHRDDVGHDLRVVRRTAGHPQGWLCKLLSRCFKRGHQAGIASDRLDATELLELKHQVAASGNGGKRLSAGTAELFQYLAVGVPDIERKFNHTRDRIGGSRHDSSRPNRGSAAFGTIFSEDPRKFVSKIGEPHKRVTTHIHRGGSRVITFTPQFDRPFEKTCDVFNDSDRHALPSQDRPLFDMQFQIPIELTRIAGSVENAPWLKAVRAHGRSE